MLKWTHQKLFSPFLLTFLVLHPAVGEAGRSTMLPSILVVKTQWVWCFKLGLNCPLPFVEQVLSVWKLSHSLTFRNWRFLPSFLCILYSLSIFRSLHYVTSQSQTRPIHIHNESDLQTLFQATHCPSISSEENWQCSLIGPASGTQVNHRTTSLYCCHQPLYSSIFCFSYLGNTSCWNGIGHSAGNFLLRNLGFDARFMTS